MSRLRVVVLGAGLTGCGIALELARRDVRVTLLDQDEWPMNRASLRNEGKIHLGLIYANAPSFETARIQLAGALRFREILERWLGEEGALLPVSTRFQYLVARDSVLNAEELESHYGRLETEYRGMLGDKPHLDYLGTRPVFLARRHAKVPEVFADEWVAAAFETSELAIDTEALAERIRGAVEAHPNVEFRGGHRVISVEPAGAGIRVEGEAEGGTFRLDADQVVNACWERAAALDRGMGLPAPKGLLHRLKYRVLVRLPEHLAEAPSATMVLGRYGDVVVRPGALSYLSWYPTGLRGWSHDVEPPREWDAACAGNPDAQEANEVRDLALKNIDAWYPGIAASVVEVVDAGAIVAVGYSDVDDRKSDLHDRSRIGVTRAGSYYSVNPGKLTTAPLFALEAAQQMLGRGQGAS